ncbi:uncharacterized protein LOC112905593 [Agrilus planipennis]|uniref:Uncharacterized protein LOC112904437 n=1 Tax=Agrilus planipennis TaxID=224129 RepID=A0A7F5QYD5_AGRPL|nr:uncharacterized protein LOC112904437 [Agrilus planipennis]XP_025834078.1 uncharacterized protein LOC112905593 [Agrilus planipennis]
METEGIQKVKIGRKKDGLEFDCLAFADDLAILAVSYEDAVKQINILKETAERAGLLISFEKTEYMTNVEQGPKFLETIYGKIKKVAKFKYLGEIIQSNGLDKEANMARTRKMETAFHLTKNVYNKKSISRNTKLKHYDTVIKPEGLYASECLAMNTAKQLDELEKKERKVIRKILGPNYEDGKWKLKSNRELYEKTERITDTMRKRRITFYGHLSRMNDDRLTKQLFDYFDKNPKTHMPWFKGVKSDLEEMGITRMDVDNREVFRSKVKNFVGFQAKLKKKTGGVWTEERRKQQSERMKDYWRIRAREKRKS